MRCNTYYWTKGCEQIIPLIHWMINHKYQCDGAIDNDRKFDNNFSLSSGISMGTSPVITFSLIGSKKNKATIIARLTCQWNNGDTNSMIKRKHTRPYYFRICSDKFEYSMDVGSYCTPYNVKMTFCMTDFSIIKIISYQYYVDNNKRGLGTSYHMFNVCNLMVQLGQMTSFKCQVIQWDCTEVPMK